MPLTIWKTYTLSDMLKGASTTAALVSLALSRYTVLDSGGGKSR